MKRKLSLLATLVVMAISLLPAPTMASGTMSSAGWSWDEGYGAIVDDSCNSSNYWQVVLFMDSDGGNPKVKICSNVQDFRFMPLYKCASSGGTRDCLSPTLFPGTDLVCYSGGSYAENGCWQSANDLISAMRWTKLTFPPSPPGGCAHHITLFMDNNYVGDSWTKIGPTIGTTYVVNPNDKASSLKNVCE